MKIAFDAKRFFHNASGLGNYSRDLVRILAEHFPENEYLLFSKNKSERGESILNFSSVVFKAISKGKAARQFLMGKDAEKAGAEIFHGLSGELPLRWNTSIKKVVTIHDLIFLHYPQFYSFIDRKIHFWKFKKAAQMADVVIAISEQTKKDIITYLKVPEAKIKVVYQTCHLACQKSQDAHFLEKVQKKFHLPERFVLNVGTVEERKNLGNIILSLQGTNIPLVVVGKKKKNYAKTIENIIKKSSVKVLFLEGVDMQELAAIYTLADIFVYPSLYEGFGIPLIEAMYCGTPVVTSNTSCLPEVGGPHALYVNPHHVEDLRSKILFLWNNPTERKLRADQSLDYVQKFNEKEIAESMMKIYKDLF